MRTYQHIIDTKSVKQVLNSIPDHWVVRDLTERDYGIDLMVEIFVEDGVDKNKIAKYEATGHVCYLQIKGTDNDIEIHDDNTISYSVDRKLLMNIEKYSTPFILIRLSTKTKVTYFLWLQRYIIEKLEKELPDWRTMDQEHFTLRIPIKNSLPANTDKIELKIAPRIKYLEEHSEFYERYTILKPAFKRIVDKNLSTDLYDSLINELKRIKNLTTLLTYNTCQVDENDLMKLIEYITEASNGNVAPKSLDDFPDHILHNLDLLEGDNFMRMAGEAWIAENDEETIY